MYIEFKELLGKTLTEIRGCERGSQEITFVTNQEEEYTLFHGQDCCEYVSVEDVCGDINDLIGTPILQAEESSNRNENPEGIKPPEEYQDSFTWTFYRISTIKGQVVIRWYGSSNGYYSESVDFVKR